MYVRPTSSVSKLCAQEEVVASTFAIGDRVDGRFELKQSHKWFSGTVSRIDPGSTSGGARQLVKVALLLIRAIQRRIIA